MVLLEVDSEAAKKQLKTIGEMARKGLNDVRRSVRKLKPDALERMSLENAIHQMIEEMSEGTNTKIYFVSYMEQMQFGAWQPDLLPVLNVDAMDLTDEMLREMKVLQ